jgi:dTDP-4-amino-4,6-dideoxygalactose transaminase
LRDRITQAVPSAYRLRVARPSLPPLERFAEALGGTWEQGMLSNHGSHVQAFQQAFGVYCQTNIPDHVFAVSNCDVALTLAVAALDLPKGSKALLPSFGFPSSIHAIEWNGLSPHFVDVHPDDWCLHAEQVQNMLDNDVALIMGTHMFGCACDVHGLQRTAERTGAALVFDAAQAVGTWVEDRHVVTFGDASTVSFSGSKIVTSAEGAIAVIRSKESAGRFSRMRAYGLDPQGQSIYRGMNGKLSELHAALGTLTLELLEQQVEQRTEHVRRYQWRLGALNGVRLQTIPSAVRATPTFLAVDLGDARESVRAALAKCGIESRPYFPPLHQMTRFAQVPRCPLAVTERLGRSLLALPLYSELDPGDIDEICEIVADVLAVHSLDG